MKPEKCIICGGKRLKPFMAYNDSELKTYVDSWVCVDCGFVMQFARDIEVQRKSYDDELKLEVELKELNEALTSKKGIIAQLQSKIASIKEEIKAINALPKSDDITLKELKERRDSIKAKKKEIEIINRNIYSYDQEAIGIEKEIYYKKQHQHFSFLLP